MTGLNLCISSIKSTSPVSKLVSSPAKSPGLSKTGPDDIFIPTSISFAIIWARVVFPRPGGP